MNWYALLADLIVVIHFGYVAFVVLGLLIILLGGVLRWRFVRNFWFRAIHLTMILIVVIEALFKIVCPLTVWEYELRIAAGQQVSDLSFVARLVHQVMFFNFSASGLYDCLLPLWTRSPCLLVAVSAKFSETEEGVMFAGFGGEYFLSVCRV